MQFGSNGFNVEDRNYIVLKRLNRFKPEPALDEGERLRSFFPCLGEISIVFSRYVPFSRLESSHNFKGTLSLFL